MHKTITTRQSPIIGLRTSRHLLMYIQHTFFTSSIAIFIIFLLSCSERMHVHEPEQSSLKEAKEIFNQTQQGLEDAGILLNFSNLGDVADLASELLLDPFELVVLEDELQQAIAGYYRLLDALNHGISTLSLAAPSQLFLPISDTDLMFIHLDLVRLYTLEAVRLILIEGFGLDGIQGTDDDLLFVSHLPNPTRYKIGLAPRGNIRTDVFRQVESDSNRRPGDLLGQFRASERQSILLALALLASPSASVPGFPNVKDIDGHPIEADIARVDRTIYQQDALFHLEHALALAKQVAPDQEAAILDFIDVIGEDVIITFADELIDWGFVFDRNALGNRIRQIR